MVNKTVLIPYDKYRRLIDAYNSGKSHAETEEAHQTTTPERPIQPSVDNSISSQRAQNEPVPIEKVNYQKHEQTNKPELTSSTNEMVRPPGVLNTTSKKSKRARKIETVTDPNRQRGLGEKKTTKRKVIRWIKL